MKTSAANIAHTIMTAYCSKSSVLLMGALLVSHAQAATQHVVESGETVKDISARYDITKTELIDANGAILGVSGVEKGQVLEIPDKDKRHNLHRIKSGDSLSSLAKQYNIDLTELARVNNLSPQSGLLIDTTLVIPVSKNSASPDVKLAAVKEAVTPPPITDISEDLTKTTAPVKVKAVKNVQAAEVTPVVPAKAPTIQPKTAPSVQVKTKPKPTSTPASTTAHDDSKNLNTKSEENHLVKYGETLAKIANKYQIDVNTLAQANDMKVSDTLYFGRSLTVPAVANKANNKATTTGKAASAAAPIVASKTTVPRKYKVQPGDTLTGIANKFKLDFRTIAKLSGIEYSAPLEIGQLLTLPGETVKKTSPNPYNKKL
ncbi:LysM peptidoglycan-binding domain-containing protein [Psychrobacter urativorans]|uniref:LysM peptidoglycan-binding domain-containing protein n=1 Tax=Psychrobacter urativorans TaxID=45610 RepID=UPI0019196B94|nr:LysM peptidoglycan-binding domain-containing protein [Psychrobacter urativorans]